MRPDPTGVRFFKMSGGGNDFIALENASLASSGQVETLCARGHSLGADGVFTIEPLADRAEPSIRMLHFNADGSRASLCVNGTRCAALLAFHLAWADDRVTIATDDAEIEASRTGDFEVTLELPPPSERVREQSVCVGDLELDGWFIDTGVPHFVLEWTQSLITAPVAELGPEIRQAEEFEDGANVDFLRFLGRDRLELRTYERGVESETLACGTGVLAAAAVAVHLGRADLPLRTLTSGGFELTVGGDVGGDGSIASWRLAGDARLIAEGTLSSGALTIPEPPLWNP